MANPIIVTQTDRDKLDGVIEKTLRDIKETEKTVESMVVDPAHYFLVADHCCGYQLGKNGQHMDQIMLQYYNELRDYAGTRLEEIKKAMPAKPGTQ